MTGGSDQTAWTSLVQMLVLSVSGCQFEFYMAFLSLNSLVPEWDNSIDFIVLFQILSEK